MRGDQSTLAALIGSRICHDLISPIGAISNGLELVGLTGALQDGPELDLIQQSCDNATARVRFFRIAFGSGSSSQMVSAKDARDTLEAHYAQTRFAALWEVDTGLSRNAVQRAFLSALCLETALPQGGRITVSTNEFGLVVQAIGEKIEEDGMLWAMLECASNSKPDTLRPAHVQFGLLSVLLADFGVELHREFTENTATLRLFHPHINGDD